MRIFIVGENAYGDDVNNVINADNINDNNYNYVINGYNYVMTTVNIINADNNAMTKKIMIMKPNRIFNGL